MAFRSHALILMALAALPAGTATAQNENFIHLFGGAQRQQQSYAPQSYAPPQALPFADPDEPDRRRASTPSGGGARVAYCVRLCDGRYFPMQRSGNASPAQLCGALCPATRTQVFNGSQIDHAYASGGRRYADLENAYVYRERIVENCSCNGKDSFGLARIDVADDPTRRPGDIVATGDNVRAALIAMHAAKERARNTLVERAAALRGPRSASSAPPPRANVPAQAAPSEATEDIPED